MSRGVIERFQKGHLVTAPIAATTAATATFRGMGAIIARLVTGQRQRTWFFNRRTHTGIAKADIERSAIVVHDRVRSSCAVGRCPAKWAPPTVFSDKKQYEYCSNGGEKGKEGHFFL
mmetsp:Transcript_20598/g.39098  ORF Transcript_20598/g.39098 Transcript_20598/m.39098 type:complete len:117 (+) Transcript_20598:866-1216(+)